MSGNLYENILKAAKDRRDNPPEWKPSRKTLASAEAYRIKRARMGDPNFIATIIPFKPKGKT